MDLAAGDARVRVAAARQGHVAEEGEEIRLLDTVVDVVIVAALA